MTILQSFNEANNADLVTVQPIYHATFAYTQRLFQLMKYPMELVSHYQTIRLI